MTSARRPSASRIVLTMLIALSVSGVAVLLGFWQYGRHVDAADAVAGFEAASHLDPVPVGDVAPTSSDASLPENTEWRMVTATGTFDPESLTVLRSRPVDGTPAWQYLAWLDTDDGRSLLVTLGWIPQPGPTEDPAVPTLDANAQVTVTAVLREWEPDDGKGAGESITRINPAQLPEPAGEAVPGYGMLREICGDEGCAQTPVGDPVPLPSLAVGPHLSYAWQWWLFGVMAPVGGVLLLRRDSQLARDGLLARDEQISDTEGAVVIPDARAGDAVRAPARASAGRRRRKGPTDEEIEDAL